MSWMATSAVILDSAMPHEKTLDEGNRFFNRLPASTVDSATSYSPVSMSNATTMFN